MVCVMLSCTQGKCIGGVLFELPEAINTLNTVIAAMNPCPCGFYGDLAKQCACAAAIIACYQKRISGPLVDRIEIH